MESESIQSRRARTVFYVNRQSFGVTIAEDTPLEDVVDSMERHRIKRVPVVREGRWSAFVSRADLLRALASAVRTLAATSRTDADIRQYVLSIACRSGVGVEEFCQCRS